jgi:ribosomal protein S18 acetylase RimI-like enzyme
MSLQSEVVISNATIDELNELHEIETLAFSDGRAASREAFLYRLQNFPQWFYKAECAGKIVGLVNGSSSDRKYITDDLYQAYGAFDESGENLLIFGLAVHTDFRKQGIAHKLLPHILSSAKERGKKRASLTCKENLIGFYEGFGFRNCGVSESVVGGVKSYDMEIDLYNDCIFTVWSVLYIYLLKAQ